MNGLEQNRRKQHQFRPIMGAIEVMPTAIGGHMDFRGCNKKLTPGLGSSGPPNSEVAPVFFLCNDPGSM